MARELHLEEQRDDRGRDLLRARTVGANGRTASCIAFAGGGAIAALTGYSYAKRGVHYESEGGGFTYLEKAFPSNYPATFGG